MNLFLDIKNLTRHGIGKGKNENGYAELMAIRVHNVLAMDYFEWRTRVYAHGRGK